MECLFFVFRTILTSKCEMATIAILSLVIASQSVTSVVTEIFKDINRKGCSQLYK